MKTQAKKKSSQSLSEQERKSLKLKRNNIFAAALFSLIMVVMAFTKVAFVPISETRMLDLTILPMVFVAMIGGYRIGIIMAIPWSIITWHMGMNQVYDLGWLLFVKTMAMVSTAYFYQLYKKVHKGSPYNVYRACIGGLIVKDIVLTIAVVMMFPDIEPREWARDTGVQFLLEIVLCNFSIALLIKHLREIHILNGIKKKKKKEEAQYDKINSFR